MQHKHTRWQLVLVHGSFILIELHNVAPLALPVCCTVAPLHLQHCLFLARCALPQDPVVDDTSFRSAVNEHRWAELSCRRHLQLIDDTECPACYPSPRSVHTDGNQKLYTLEGDSAVPGSARYDDVLFADTHLGMQHLQYLDLAIGKVSVVPLLRPDPFNNADDVCFAAGLGPS